MIKVKKLEKYPGYAVSSLGNVWSKWIKYKRKQGKWHRMKMPTNSDGYQMVCIRDENNKKKSVKVHRLVANAFIENPNKLRCVLHKDGNPSNNNVMNLYWGTDVDNKNDSIMQNTHAKGEKHGQSKLKEKDISLIRHLRASSEMSCRRIGEIFNVSGSAITAIVKNITWKHI